MIAISKRYITKLLGPIRHRALGAHGACSQALSAAGALQGWGPGPVSRDLNFVRGWFQIRYLDGRFTSQFSWSKHICFVCPMLFFGTLYKHVLDLKHISNVSQTQLKRISNVSKSDDMFWKVMCRRDRKACSTDDMSSKQVLQTRIRHGGGLLPLATGYIECHIHYILHTI